ncbi:MAG: cation-translocating P-type ATPase [Spirochaetia bacterium]
MEHDPLPGPPWTLTVKETADSFSLELDEGLESETAERYRELYGENRLREQPRKSAWALLLEQFKSIIIVLLGAAGAVSFVFSELLEGAAITGVIIINTLIGFITELKAVRSMEALEEMGESRATVRRDGEVESLPARMIVAGDLLIIEPGDIIPADVRLVEAAGLQADESPLTGESVPVTKHTDPLDPDTPLAERGNMLYKGSIITRGTGRGVVTAVGTSTELGNISEMVEEAEEGKTPLEKRLNRLGRVLIYITLAVAAAIGVTGIAAGRETLVMIKTAVALAVASIPEGLPIVATIALARGMWIMVRENALIGNLSSVETLGTTNVICTDKTGTLTENRMTAESFEIPSDGGAETLDLSASGEYGPETTAGRALRIGALCTNAETGDDPEDVVGDPLEIALLEAAEERGFSRGGLLEEMPEEREVAFDTETKMMATIHRTGEGFYYAVKGAPEAVFDVCTTLSGSGGRFDETVRGGWAEKVEELASRGMRLIALAEKKSENLGDEPYENLVFLGLAALYDPPREGVKDSVEGCRKAGVRVVMVTGDQKTTAREIARRVGIYREGDLVVEGNRIEEYLDAGREEELKRAAVFARVTPKQKLTIIRLYKKTGAVVAMTGDGVNDAPALKQADIGVSMGIRGTEVAREASDMVLQDDALSTIVAAIREGRIIFGNIRRFVLYLLSGNLSEIIAVGIASLAGLPLPLLPLQILFLNMITDVFPALALGVGRGDGDVMTRAAREPGEPVLRPVHWGYIVGYSGVIAGVVLGSMLGGLHWLGADSARVVTFSFLTLGFAKVWHVFNMRNRSSGILRNEITRNKWVWAAVAACAVLLAAAVYLPGLSTVLETVRPGPRGWAVILAMSFIPLFMGQIEKGIACKKGGRSLF